MDQEQQVDQPASVKSEVWEWVKALLIAAVLVILIRWLVFASFIVEGPSMEPNFYTGERLIVNKVIYHIRKPERGEVVVFHATEDKDYIKRVIALPGETVKIEEDKVFVDGKELDEPYIRDVVEEYKKNNVYYNTNFNEVKVPEDTVFVMGDNRRNSTDSRMLGPIADDKIIGRADVIFWPFNKIQWIRH